MRKTVFILIMLFAALQISAQTTAKGIVKDSGTGLAVQGATITLMQQNISTQTNANGEFYFSYIESGDEELSATRNGYFAQISIVKLKDGIENDLGTISLRPDIQAENKQDIILQLSESQLDDEGTSQAVAGSFSSQTDVYISQTSFSFSPMRFRTRGYDNKYESTYINGVRFVDMERGGFNYSSLGGLNNATRNKDLTYGLTPNAYSYGNLGGNTNINTKASSFAAGSHGSVGFSNRSYKLRAQYTYGTGVMSNGWAFAASGVVRWADEGIIEGTFYNSAGLFLSAEKIINPDHSISLVAFGAPTRRGQQGGTTQEVYDMVGSTYYNPNWGYQDGKKRNSRVVESFDPTAILSHDWKITEKQRLRTGLAFHYSNYSSSAFIFSNAPDPRPDYYRNLPSFSTDETTQKWISNEWRTNTSVSQVDWKELYLENALNNDTFPKGQLKYGLERRHNNLMETALNSVYTNEFNNHLKLTAGIEARYSKGMHYKTMDDLLGANQLIDIDSYTERDFPNSIDMMQNDLRNPNRSIRVSDVFGYNYDMNIITGNAFALSEFTFSHFDAYIGAKLTYTRFQRVGHMQNGRAPQNSYGAGKTWYFTDPSLKGGFTYKINGRNRISANVLAETRAPSVNDSYVSERIKDDRVRNLKSEQILSYDLNYSFSFPFMRGRVSGFRTHVLGSTEKLGYYDDEYRTFINHILTDADKIFQGVELGVSVPINSSFTVSAAGTYADYSYTSDSRGVKSPENGSFADITETVLTKGLKVNNGPQMAANITIDYFHPKMWFADLTLNYYGNNYLDFAPNRFTENNMAKYTTDDMKKALGTQEKLDAGFVLDASVGKLIYLKNRKSLNINLSASNILNNRDLITGGYQQARLPLDNKVIDEANLNRFPNKYYYAWGFNFFLHVGYKF